MLAVRDMQLINTDVAQRRKRATYGFYMTYAVICAERGIWHPRAVISTRPRLYANITFRGLKHPIPFAGDRCLEITA